MSNVHAISLPGNKLLELAEGDITRQTTDAIVNAANSSLLGGGGVDGAIHRAGGPAILKECQKLRATKYPDGLPAGQAVATTAGNMPAKYVIHTVGPIYHGGTSGEPETLASAYRESIRVADELEIKSIAFPSISTGAYGYPIDDAAHIALQTVIESLKSTRHIQLVRFVLFGASAFNVYEGAAPFPKGEGAS
jgi:O-acetyl-ADP-ribose deacetylase (regulator of RNase III)